MSKSRTRRWYHDPHYAYAYMLRGWVVFVLWLGIIVALVGGLVGGIMLVDKSGCGQRAVSRPDVPVEWHWNTGCITLNPDQVVVVSE